MMVTRTNTKEWEKREVEHFEKLLAGQIERTWWFIRWQMWEKGDSMRTPRFIVCITWQIVVLTTNVGNTDMGSELIIMGFKKKYFWEDNKFTSDHVFEGAFSYAYGDNNLEFVHIALE